jgi:DNA-binding transcriptional ArsR family regulator
MSRKDLSGDKSVECVDLLSRYAHLLLILVRDQDATIRDISIILDLTERTVHRTLNQLREEGYISIERVGRRNRYRVLADMQSTSRFENNCRVGDVLGLVVGQGGFTKPSRVDEDRHCMKHCWPS